MFVNFSEEAKHIIKQAERQKEELKHPYVGSEHLLLSILKDSKLKDIFKKNKITYDNFKEKLISIVGIGTKQSDFNLYTPLFKRVLENAIIEAREEGNKSVSPELIIISILDEEDGIAYSILKSMKVNMDKLYFDIRNKKFSKSSKKKKLLLEEQGVDLLKLAREKKIDPVIGRDKEIKKTIEILLRRKKNNPILLGPAGVGKTAIVEGIANIMVSSNCPDCLKNKRLISLNIFQLVSGTKYRGEFEEKMKILIKELEENEDIILFIDEIHTMVGAGGAEGAIDASNIFKPALARGRVRIIGATTMDEYKKYIEPDAALSRRFQSVIIEEPSTKDVINILKNIKPLYEKFHNICIKDKLIEDIVLLSDKYLSNRFEPDRSIDILDEVCAKTSIYESKEELKKKNLTKSLQKIEKEKNKALQDNNFKLAYELKKEENKISEKLKNIKISKKMVSKQDIIDVVKNKGNLTIMEDDNKNLFYEEIKRDLKKIVYGQDENIDKLIKALRKKDILRKKECHSILITGKSGSGKTLLAENYAKKLANEKNIIRIDASEYFNYHTISKLIGTTAGYLGYDNKNNVFEKVKTNPNSVLIIDDYEEGCEEFKNIFNRILEYGYVEDAKGSKIDFSNSTVIFINKSDDTSFSLGFNKDLVLNRKEKDNSLKNISVFINMKTISKEVLKKVIKDKINLIIKKYPQIYIEYDKSLENEIYDKIKDNNLSELDNLMEKYFELKIVDAIIDNKKRINIKVNEESIV